MYHHHQHHYPWPFKPYNSSDLISSKFQKQTPQFSPRVGLVVGRYVWSLLKWLKSFTMNNNNSIYVIIAFIDCIIIFIRLHLSMIFSSLIPVRHFLHANLYFYGKPSSKAKFMSSGKKLWTAMHTKIVSNLDRTDYSF